MMLLKLQYVRTVNFYELLSPETVKLITTCANDAMYTKPVVLPFTRKRDK